MQIATGDTRNPRVALTSRSSQAATTPPDNFQPAHPKIYVASPLGFSEATRGFYQNTVIPTVHKAGFEVLDPWTNGQEIEQALTIKDPEERKAKLAEADKIAAHQNSNMIRSAQGVLAILDGTDADSGTSSEVGFAAGLGRQIQGYRGDFRLSSDNEGTTVNLQVEGFIGEGGGTVSRSLEEAVNSLKERLHPTPWS